MNEVEYIEEKGLNHAYMPTGVRVKDEIAAGKESVSQSQTVPLRCCG